MLGRRGARILAGFWANGRMVCVFYPYVMRIASVPTSVGTVLRYKSIAFWRLVSTSAAAFLKLSNLAGKA
jgi:hypothetical protein